MTNPSPEDLGIQTAEMILAYTIAVTEHIELLKVAHECFHTPGFDHSMLPADMLHDLIAQSQVVTESLLKNFKREVETTHRILDRLESVVRAAEKANEPEKVSDEPLPGL